MFYLDRFAVIEYDEDIKYHTILLCILEPLYNSINGFEKVVLTHLQKKRKLILSTIEKWCKNGSQSFKENMIQVCLEILSSLFFDPFNILIIFVFAYLFVCSCS